MRFAVACARECAWPVEALRAPARSRPYRRLAWLGIYPYVVDVHAGGKPARVDAVATRPAAPDREIQDQRCRGRRDPVIVLPAVLLTKDLQAIEEIAGRVLGPLESELDPAIAHTGR